MRRGSAITAFLFSVALAACADSSQGTKPDVTGDDDIIDDGGGEMYGGDSSGGDEDGDTSGGTTGGTDGDCAAHPELCGGGSGSGSGSDGDGGGGGGDGGGTDYDFGGQCAFTLGFWKTHPEAWPVSSLTLGTVSYTHAELQTILDSEIVGNGLLTLAHQLIAAKLNVAIGAPTSAIGATIEDADEMIGGSIVPPVGTDTLPTETTSALNNALDRFNTSKLEGDECEPAPACGDGHVDPGEDCDDGNVMAYDGCSATCRHEHLH